MNKVKKDSHDYTSSDRQRKYLDELNEKGGRAVRIDLSAEDLLKLDELVEVKKAASRAAFIRTAIRNAYTRIKNRKD
jgi:metal-responsive CopG/Arc/MetJ family transcriptional regulator